MAAEYKPPHPDTHEHWFWEPKPDITVWELAWLLRHMGCEFGKRYHCHFPKGVLEQAEHGHIARHFVKAKDFHGEE